MTAPMTEEQTVNMHVAARWWASQGVPVFPLHHPIRIDSTLTCSCRKPGCKSPAKHPLTPNGLDDATTDLDQVDRWWRQHPEANIGLRTGVIFDLFDVDGKAGFAALEQLKASLGGEPQAVAVCVSGRAEGGRHYFVVPPGKKALTGGLTAPTGLDVKGVGGYAVGAPSRHISGSRYHWLDEDHHFDGTVTGDIGWDELYAALAAAAPKTPPRTVPPQPFDRPAPIAAGGSFSDAVLNRILGDMRSAVEGHRWQVFATKCAFDVARGILGGTLDRTHAEIALRAAARDAGLDTDEIDRLPGLIDDALRKADTPIAPKPREPQPTAKVWTADDAVNTEWEPPDSLDLHVPPFPTDALGWMQQPVEALADELQTPVDVVAMLLLATVSAATLGRGQVEITPRWAEPLNLYVAVIAGAGETKSPALAIVSRPIRDMEARMQNADRGRVAELEQRRRIYKSRLDKAEKQAANDVEKMVEAAEAQRLLTELEEPVLPRILAADTTPEGLVQLLAQQKGVLAVLSAEGGLFDTLAGGRYSSGMANLDAVLQAHDGREPILVDRKGSPPIRVERPTLTLGLAVQPQVLAAVGKSEAAVGRGFLARFLYSVPQTLVGSRRVTRPGPEADFSAFEKVVQGVDAQLGGGSGGIGDQSLKVNLKLSSSSLELFYDYRELLEPRRHPRKGDLAGVRAWANKLDGQIARLAGLLHLIYLADGPQYPHNPVVGTEIGPVALSGALEIADYLIGHATAAHLLMAGDALAASDTALQLLGWLRVKGLAEFTVRDAQQSLKRRVDFKKVDAVRDAAEVLARHGYLRRIENDTGTPGRPPSERYLVNPLEPA